MKNFLIDQKFFFKANSFMIHTKHCQVYTLAYYLPTKSCLVYVTRNQNRYIKETWFARKSILIMMCLCSSIQYWRLCLLYIIDTFLDWLLQSSIQSDKTLVYLVENCQIRVRRINTFELKFSIIYPWNSCLWKKSTLFKYCEEKE